MCVTDRCISFTDTGFLLYYTGYISTEVAIWVATGVFVLAAIYESFLLSLVAKHMLDRLKEDASTS